MLPDRVKDRTELPAFVWKASAEVKELPGTPHYRACSMTVRRMPLILLE